MNHFLRLLCVFVLVFVATKLTACKNKEPPPTVQVAASTTVQSPETHNQIDIVDYPNKGLRCAIAHRDYSGTISISCVSLHEAEASEQ